MFKLTVVLNLMLQRTITINYVMHINHVWSDFHFPAHLISPLLRDRSIFMWGGGGSWGGPRLLFVERRGGRPKENFTMIGGGSLCVL